MQYLVVLVAVCLASPALGAYGGHYGGYNAPHGGYTGPEVTPVVTPNGFLADTPEVAAAKAAHYSEVARAQNHPTYRSYDDGSYKASYNDAPASYAAPSHASYAAPAQASYAAPSYGGPAQASYAAPSYGGPAQASYAAPSYGAPAYSSGSHYTGPYAKPVITPNGFLADTPEVAAAKAAHFSEVAKVQSAPGYTANNAYDDGSYRPATAYASAPAAYANAPASYGNQGYYGAPAAPTGGYTGPLAKPVITHNGFLADTPEVAAAKAAHFSEVAKSQSQYGYGQGHGHRYRRSLVLAQTPAHTVPLTYAASHVVPVIAAAPVAHISYAAPVAHYAYPVHRRAFAYAVHH